LKFTSDISSSGCINFVVIPDEPLSGFLTVGAADMVADETAAVVTGNVGAEFPEKPFGLKSGPTGAELLDTDTCKERKIHRFAMDV
jgi:hypothetical protein